MYFLNLKMVVLEKSLIVTLNIFSPNRVIQCGNIMITQSINLNITFNSIVSSCDSLLDRVSSSPRWYVYV